MSLLSLLWYTSANRFWACKTSSVSSATDVTHVVVKHLSSPLRFGEPALGLLSAKEKEIKSKSNYWTCVIYRNDYLRNSLICLMIKLLKRYQFVRFMFLIVRNLFGAFHQINVLIEIHFEFGCCESLGSWKLNLPFLGAAYISMESVKPKAVLPDSRW